MTKTGLNTHRATQRGYAIEPKTHAGSLIEPGDYVPPDQPVSQIWMVESDKYEAPVDDDLPAASRLTTPRVGAVRREG